MYYLEKQFMYDNDNKPKNEAFDGKYFITWEETFNYMETNEYRLLDNEVLIICEVEL